MSSRVSSLKTLNAERMSNSSLFQSVDVDLSFLSIKRKTTQRES